MKFRLLTPEEIECRVSTVKANGFSILLYKDARVDMNMLDEIIGAEYWQRDHKEIKGNVYCGISIYVNLGNEDTPNWQWVTKWDAGAESYTEKVKGEASDSFKRAGFNWGIGRELYTPPFIWIKPKDDKEIKVSEFNGKKKYTTYAKMFVKEIAYTDDKITWLVIKDETGKVRFTFGTQPPLDERVVSELVDLDISMGDMYKWFDYFKVSYEETDSLADVCKRLTKKDAEFIIDRFNNRRK